MQASISYNSVMLHPPNNNQFDSIPIPFCEQRKNSSIDKFNVTNSDSLKLLGWPQSKFLTPSEQIPYVKLFRFDKKHVYLCTRTTHVVYACVLFCWILCMVAMVAMQFAHHRVSDTMNINILNFIKKYIFCPFKIQRLFSDFFMPI